jgi:predicted RND superfamily exporter protein
MRASLLPLYEKLFLARPLLTLLLLLAILCGFAVHVPHFKLDASADALVLEGDEALQYYRKLVQRYGSEEYLVITYRPGADLFSEEALEGLRSLADDLAEVGNVSSVVTMLDVPLLDSPRVALSDLSDGFRTLATEDTDRELARKEFRDSPLYKNLLTSFDGQTTALQVNLKSNKPLEKLLLQRETLRAKRREQGLNEVEQAELAVAEQAYRDAATVHTEQQRVYVEEVRAILDRHRDKATIFLGGVPMIAADMISFIQSDLLVFGGAIVLFMILVLATIFRKPRWVLIPLTTCLFTAITMLGFFTWLDWRMTVISSNFLALLLIITLSVTIHLVVRYRELHAKNPGMEQRELVLETVRFMARPCLYTSLTTVVAFASLVVSGIRPVIDFGWMMTISVMAALVAVFLLLPCLLLLIKKDKPVRQNEAPQAFTLRFARITENYGTAILWVALLLTVASLVGISRLEVENRFIDYFHESTEIYQGMEVIDRELGGTIPLDIIIEGNNRFIASEPADSDGEDDFEDDFGDDFDDDFGDDFADSTGPAEEASVSPWFTTQGLQLVERVHDHVESLDETGKVLSLATLYKVIGEIMERRPDDIQLAVTYNSLPDELRNSLVAPYLDEEANQARLTVRVKETSRTLRRAELLDALQDYLVNDVGLEAENVRFSGMLVLYNNMLQSLYRSQILTLGAVFVAIMLMFVVLFRSFYLALLAIAPNMLAAAIVLGGMGWAGIPLDIMTITIAAIVVGIGVDNTIHYVHRFRREFAEDGDYLATMYRCHGSIGRAMYYTSVTIIVGFSILAFSNFRPSIYFGLLTAFAMFAALMGALMLLPKLLLFFKPLGVKS